VNGSINLDACEHAERVIGRVCEFSPAEGTGGVMVLPGINANRVEILLAGATVFQFLILLIHLREANGAVSIILQINVLGIFSSCIHTRLEAVGELLIENLIGGLGDLCSAVGEIVE
jgi:hypothetical protein